MHSIQKLLKEYLDYLEIEKNRSQKTRENYERYLRAFFATARVASLKDITAEAVRDFRISLARRTQNGKGLKKNTQSYYVIAIRNFLKYLIQHDYPTLSPDKIELPKLPMRQIDILNYKDVERLLQTPTGNSLRALRDRAILELLFSTGLRLAELCKLSRYLDLERGEFTVRGKGEKLRVVFLSNSAKEAIRHYLSARTDPHPMLFVGLTKKNTPVGAISPRAVERLVQFWSRKAGITEKVTPHSLRHQFATDLLVNGADLRSVQELLGHRNITTTQIYTHLTNKELREIHRAFHGRRRTGTSDAS